MKTIHKTKHSAPSIDKGEAFSKQAGTPLAPLDEAVSSDMSGICGTIELPEIQEPKEDGSAGSSLEKIPDADWDTLVECTSAMALRTQYKQAANSHKNMLARRKTHGAIVAPEFINFKSFMLHMGPPPAKDATLDRIDPSDPEYAPGKVRWADKSTQANNKTNTLLFHCSKTGMTYTASQLAKTQNVDLSTIHKRRSNGWTDDEVIAGHRFTQSDVASGAMAGSFISVCPLSSSVPGELASEELVSFKVWMDIFIKFKAHIDIEFVEEVQKRLSARFPEVQKAHYSTFSPAFDFSAAPQKRWSQLHHMFPITRRIAEQISDLLAWDVCPDLRPEISARKRTRIKLVKAAQKAAKEAAFKDEEWQAMCLAGEIDEGDIPDECYAHLAGIHTHILDAHRLYVSLKHADETASASFADFVLTL